MKITFTQASPSLKGSAVIVFARSKAKLSESAAALDKQSGGAIKRAMSSARFEGDSGQILQLLAPSGVDANRIVVLGLGKPGELARTDFTDIGGSITAKLISSGEKSAVVLFDDIKGLKVDPADAMAEIGAGLRLRSYRFDKYRTREPASKKPSLVKAVIKTSAATMAKKLYAEADKLIDGVFCARDLVSEPANVIYPESYAAEIQKLSKDGLKIEILDEKAMKKLGMNALLAVGMGSSRESRLAIMRWDGAAKGKQEKPIAFVGKGVTFDTGGISLKPAVGMEQMKWDMGGSATVVGLMKALAGRKARVNAIGIVGLVENMPSGNAQRPGDVVTSMSGQTIEVLNTDAEGRLVLADALWYCQDRFKPEFMIDLATLTGAMMVSLGQEYAGFFTTSDKLATQIFEAGNLTGDKTWRMPLHKNYDKQINTPTADVKNMGGKYAGAITAAQFLKRFVNDVPWAHIDIAGMAWSDTGSAIAEKGATGYGVRLLDRFVRDNCEQS